MTDTKHRSDRPEPTDEQVARLVAAAGRRPRYDEELDKLRPAVEQAWRDRVARERRPRPARMRATVLAWAAALMVLLAAGWFAVRILAPDAQSSTLGPVAEVVALTGTVASDRGPLALGAELAANASLDAEGGALALETRSGGSVRLAAGSRARLLDATHLSLERGTAYVDSDPAGRGGARGGFVIETPLGSARDVGTQFAVELGATSLTLRVREGLVELEQKGAKLSVAAGEEVEADSSGAVARHRIEPTAPEWAWIASVAHPFEVEGATVSAYLAWVRRETGLRVRYATAAVRTQARTTVLHGASQGLEPLEGLDVFLLSAGLDHRIDGADLVIEQSGEDGAR